MTFTRLVTSTALAAALILPSAAAFAQDAYYIVQDVKTKKCAIVDKKPATTAEHTVVGPDGTVYKTRTEAETAMKTVKVCTTS
jgi:hypothetical protein